MKIMASSPITSWGVDGETVETESDFIFWDEYSLEGLMLKLKLQYFGHLMARTDSLEKTLMLGKIEGRRGRGRQRMRWLDGITDSLEKTLMLGGIGPRSKCLLISWLQSPCAVILEPKKIMSATVSTVSPFPMK